MSALHLQLHPEPSGDTLEGVRDAQSDGCADLHHQNTRYSDTPTQAQPAAHCNTENERACVPQNDTRCPVSAPEIAPATVHFLDTLFGDQAGQLCLGYIDGDPQIEAMRQEWYSWPRQRPLVLQRFAEHDAQGHDIYVRQVLYSRRDAHAPYALPSSWIWRDDVQETRTAYTLLIETSEGNYQALVQLDRLATTEERARLMTHWRDKHADSDACSADPVHFVRVPGGHNRKHHGCYSVRLADQTGRVYPADTLLGRCGGDTRPPSRSAAGHWRDLPDGAALLQSTRWQKIIQARPQLRQLFIARRRVTITNKNGSTDSTMSAQRAVLIQNLITACPYGRLEHLPEREIRAVALTLQATFGEGKTDRDYQTDIDRLIDDYRPRNYTPAATRAIAGQAQAPRRKAAEHRTPRGRAGDHRALVESVYDVLKEHRAGAQAIVTVGDLADVIHCHRRTIATVLQELRDAGRIATRRLGRHSGLVVEFLDVIYSPEPAAVQAVETPQTDDRGAPAIEETGILPGGCVSSIARSDHSLPLVLLAWHPPLVLPPPTLADLAAHYLDQRPAAIGEEYVIKRGLQAGLVAYRRTAKHFAGLVVADYGRLYTFDQALDAYAAEQQRRKDIVAAEWQRFFAQLRKMTNDELIAYVGGRCRTEVAEMARDGAIFDKHLYTTRLKCARRELQRRGLEMPSRKTRIAQQAAEDAQRAQQARQRLVPPKAPLVACQPRRYAQPVPVIEQSSAYDAAATIARLFARKRTNQHDDHASENCAPSSA